MLFIFAFFNILLASFTVFPVVYISSINKTVLLFNTSLFFNSYTFCIFFSRSLLFSLLCSMVFFILYKHLLETGILSFLLSSFAINND